MKTKISTSIEQSKRLIELGFDVNTADMFWLTTDKPRLHVLVENLEKYSRWDCMPAWSLPALLYLLENPQLFNHDNFWRCDGYTTVGYCHDNAIDAVFEVVEVEAEKFQKGTKKPGIRRSIIKNKQLYHET